MEGVVGGNVGGEGWRGVEGGSGGNVGGEGGEWWVMWGWVKGGEELRAVGEVLVVGVAGDIKIVSQVYLHFFFFII